MKRQLAYCIIAALAICACNKETPVQGDFIRLRAEVYPEAVITKAAVEAEPYTQTSPSTGAPLHADVWFSTTSGTYPGTGGISGSTMDIHSAINYDSGAYTFPEAYGSENLRYPTGNTVHCVGFWPQNKWDATDGGTKAQFKSGVNIDGVTDFLFAPQISGSSSSPLSTQNFQHIQTWIKVRVRAQTSDAPLTWGKLQNITISTKCKPTIDLSTGEITYSDDPGDVVNLVAYDNAEGYDLSTDSKEISSLFVAPMTGTLESHARMTFDITTEEWSHKIVNVDLMDNDGSYVIDTTAGKLYVVTLCFESLAIIEGSAALNPWVEENRDVTGVQ